jgi:hypothetical protein
VNIYRINRKRLLTALSLPAIILLMNRKQEKMLEAIFTKPTLANINFSDIENLLTGLGAELTEGRGSRISFELNGESIFLHRPHPGKEAKKYQVEAIREFLERTGFTNE